MTKQEIIDYMYENHVQGDFKIEEMAEDLEQPEVIRCKDCIHYTPLGIDGAWGRCAVHSSPTENQRMCQEVDYCSWAELRGDSDEND